MIRQLLMSHLLAMLLTIMPAALFAQQPSDTLWRPDVTLLDGSADDSRLVLAQATQPMEPSTEQAAPSAATGTEPSTVGQRPANVFNQTRPDGSGIGWLGNVFLSTTETFVDASPLGGFLDAAFLDTAQDAATLLKTSPAMNYINRAYGQNEPVLQGRRLGQTPARGSYWFPARQDMDTVLSKIDSRLVDEIIAIKGPYSALYGPGLSFFDVQLLDTPRYGSPHLFGSTSTDYRTNGQGWYGRQNLWGGSADWGFRAGYGHRTGNDYETGGGVDLPSSYNSRIGDFSVGKDVTSDSRVEFRYLRLDETGVEFPGQVFDINFLTTDGYEIIYTAESLSRVDRLTVEGWYNRTRFEGDNLGAGKRRQVPSLDGPFTSLESETDVDAMSTGYRFAMAWDDTMVGDLVAGTDFRYLKQRLNELNSLVFTTLPIPTATVNTPIPRSHSSNPGVFLETRKWLSDRLSVKAGSRFDWVSTNADTSVPGVGDDLEADLRGEFDQHFRAWSAFLSTRYEMNSHWSVDGAFGHAMRPPTTTELYADGPFIAALPQIIYTSMFGNPNLRAERMWQIDLGLTGSYENLRGGIHGFYSWINDYITFDLIEGPLPSTAYGYVNTDLATLAGFELFTDCTLTDRLSVFGTMGFVEGRDLSRNEGVHPLRADLVPGSLRSGSTTAHEPLPVIPPLDSRIGVSLHEACASPSWSVEFLTRIADVQDRVATSLREQETPGFSTYDVRAYAVLLDNLIVTAGVENLTDKLYQTHFDTRVGAVVYQPGINYYFGTQITY